MSVLGYMTICFAVVLPISAILHIIRMIKEQSSEGQSLAANIVALVCTIFLFSYGIEQSDPVLITANTLWLIILTIIIVCIMKYRSNSDEYEQN